MTTLSEGVIATPAQYALFCSVCRGEIGTGDLMFPFEPLLRDAHRTATKLPRVFVWCHAAPSCSTKLITEHADYPHLATLRETDLTFRNRDGSEAPFFPDPAEDAIKWVTPLCKHWRLRSRCAVNDAGLCAFAHHRTDVGVPTSHTEVATAKRGWGGKRRQICNKDRASVFRIWLSNTYGLEYLRSETGTDSDQKTVVMDIAGGRGDLAWELKNCTGVPETVVLDPRDACFADTGFRQCETKWRRGFWDRTRTGPVFSKCNPRAASGPPRPPPLTPLHFRTFLRAETFHRFLFTQTDSEIIRNKWFTSELHRASSIMWTRKGLEDHHDDDEASSDEETKPLGALYHENVEKMVEGDGDGEVEEGVEEEGVVNGLSQASRLLQATKLLVGMHPDEAAAEIVATAVHCKVPFAVIPCCVHLKTFPKRKLRNNTRVTTYEDLVQYLMEMHPKSRQCELDFEGRNVCVYTLPEDME